MRLLALHEGLRFVVLVEVDSLLDFVHIYGLFKEAVSRVDDLSVCGEVDPLIRMNEMCELNNMR